VDKEYAARLNRMSVKELEKIAEEEEVDLGGIKEKVAMVAALIKAGQLRRQVT
jgi:hypothetical protein